MPEENSSSQNVNLFITAISKRGTSGAGFTVGLSDGSSFFISESFPELNNLKMGMEIDEVFFELLRGESEFIEALHKAGDLISRAEQSSGGLFLKLKKKGFSTNACNHAVSRSRELGLLDDLRFAELWISSRLRKHPEGQSMLYNGLVSRGVNPELARDALHRFLTEDMLLKAVLTAGTKISVRCGNSEQKLRQSLYRRGFSSREINYYFENTDV